MNVLSLVDCGFNIHTSKDETICEVDMAKFSEASLVRMLPGEYFPHIVIKFGVIRRYIRYPVFLHGFPLLRSDVHPPQTWRDVPLPLQRIETPVVHLHIVHVPLLLAPQEAGKGLGLIVVLDDA
jgi:hypothetical protein